MTARPLIAGVCLVLLGACRARPAGRTAPDEAAFAVPAGKRAFSLTIDKSQTRFLSPGAAVEVVILVETPRADGTRETRSELLVPRAEVLRVRKNWAENTGLIQLALTPEQVQFAALAVDREDRLFLNKVPETAELGVLAPAAKEASVLAAGHRGLAVLVYPDQQAFLTPGVRVDVVATRQSAKASGKSELTALTLLQNVLVLGGAPPEGEEEWSTVQLMLTPDQTAVLTRAVSAEDHLTLTVRAPDDAATRPVEPAKMSRKFGTPAERASPKS